MTTSSFSTEQKHSDSGDEREQSINPDSISGSFQTESAAAEDFKPTSLSRSRARQGGTGLFSESSADEGPLLLPEEFYATAYSGPSRFTSPLSVKSRGHPRCSAERPMLINPNPPTGDGVRNMATTFDIYAEVTGKIVAMLEAGVIPWRSPILGQQKSGWPKNLDSGKPYRGVNVFLLAFTSWAKGYESAHWLTFNQAKAIGGSVKKGEKSSMVVFWKQYATKDRQTGEAVVVPVLRYFNVFNVQQCDGVAVPDAPVYEPTPFNPIEAAEAIVNGYEGRPEIEHAGSRAYYTPKTDAVTLPSPSRFSSNEEYYGTLFHELAHSTGHSKRLDRGIDSELRAFTSAEYAREELVAEMTAAFLCGHAGIAPATVENSAAYIGGWIKTLKGDKRLAVAAAGAGQRATDWILNNRGTGDSVAGTVGPAPVGLLAAAAA